MGKPKKKRPGKPRKYGAGDGQICVPLTISVPRWIRDRLDAEPDGRSSAAFRLISDGLEITPLSVPRRRSEETA